MASPSPIPVHTDPAAAVEAVAAAAGAAKPVPAAAAGAAPEAAPPTPAQPPPTTDGLETLPLHKRAAQQALRGLPLVGPWEVEGEKLPTKRKWEKAEVTACSASFYKNKTVVIPASDKKKGQQVELAQLHNCRVVVLGSCGNYMVDDCTNCEFVLGPCSGSMFIRDCTDLCITGACQQLRMRDLNNAQFFIHTETDPCVEASSAIVLRPLNIKLPHLATAFDEAKLRAPENRFRHAADFSRFVDTEKEDGFSVPPWVGVVKMRTTDLEGVHGALTAPAALEEILDGRCKGGESLETETFHMGQTGMVDAATAAAIHEQREAAKEAKKAAGAPQAPAAPPAAKAPPQKPAAKPAVAAAATSAAPAVKPAPKAAPAQPQPQQTPPTAASS